MFLKRLKANLDVFDKLVGASVVCALTILGNFLPPDVNINISLRVFIGMIIGACLLGYLLRTIFHRITSKRKIRISDVVIVKDNPYKKYVVESYHWLKWWHIICIDYADKNHSKHIIHEKHVELFTLKKQQKYAHEQFKKIWS